MTLPPETPLRVGILTSWRVPCGIYQHSARLADALAQIGHQPVILAGRADEGRSYAEESAHEVHDVAQIGLWRDDGQYALNIEKVLSLRLDALHVQYESMLFNQEPLAELAACFRSPNAYHGPTAITFHDSCIRGDFPYQAFDLHFTHRQGVGRGEVIPFGIENRQPVVRTFGLGRTRSDLIAPICERNGWAFETVATHEPIRGGGQEWRTHEDLIAWLRGADAIVLWYDDNQMAGSSQATRTALAARRPVVTNDTSWFSDLPDETRSYRKVHSLEELESVLVDRFADPYLATNSWRRVAGMLVERYQRAGLA